MCCRIELRNRDGEVGPFLLPAVAPPASSAIWTLASLFLPGFPSFVSGIDSSVYLGTLCVGLLRVGAPGTGNAGHCGCAVPGTWLVRCSAGGWELQREAPGGSSGREGINKGICAQREGPAGKAAALAAKDPCGSGSLADHPRPDRPPWCDPLLLSF